MKSCVIKTEQPIFRSAGKAPLILASSSPRRRDLLAGIGLDFHVCSAPYLETPPKPGEHPDLYARRMAAGKAATAFASRRNPFPVIIAADTVVCLGNDIFGKPGTITSAHAMLCALNGRAHQVFTAVHIIWPDGSFTAFCEMTYVYFSKWPLSVLEAYVSASNPLDKAGAYGIQNEGCFLVEKLDGSYTNVLGLPLTELTQILLARGYIEPVPYQIPI